MDFAALERTVAASMRLRARLELGDAGDKQATDSSVVSN